MSATETRFNIGAEVRRYIRENGLSQTKFAVACGINPSVLNRMMRVGDDIFDGAIDTIECVLNGIGRTMDEYDPRIARAKDGMAVAQEMLGRGIPTGVLSARLGFASVQLFSRTINFISKGVSGRSSYRCMVNLSKAADETFRNECERYLQGEADTPEAEVCTSVSNEMNAPKMLTIARRFGFSDGDLEEAQFNAADKTLVWYSNSRLYRFEMTQKMLIGIYCATGQVSLRRAVNG